MPVHGFVLVCLTAEQVLGASRPHFLWQASTQRQSVDFSNVKVKSIVPPQPDYGILKGSSIFLFEATFMEVWKVIMQPGFELCQVVPLQQLHYSRTLQHCQECFSCRYTHYLLRVLFYSETLLYGFLSHIELSTRRGVYSDAALLPMFTL